MKQLNTDILIIGGGLTGLASAFALSSLNKKIIVIDRVNFTFPGDFQDFRTTAIAEGSKVFFEKIGLWKKLRKFSQPIKNIRVEDRNKRRKILFNNKIDNNNLGYIILNSDIKKQLLNELKLKKNIKLINNNEFFSLQTLENKNIALFDKYKIASKLVIAADGKNSTVRSFLKTKIFKKHYPHNALVVNFDHLKDHKNTAFELFFKSGPLAILPMKKRNKKYFSSSLIWTNTKDYTAQVKKLDKNLLRLILQEKIFSYTGNISKIHSVQSFPLSAHINSSFYNNRLIYIGDSAHSIHPIAGQGWNLGVRDIVKCLSVLEYSEKLGLDIGSSEICKKYHDLCYSDSFSLYQITDKLNSIFLNDKYILNWARVQGFKFIDNNKNIKNYITNFAMGFK